MIQSKAKIKAKRKKLGDREKELLAEIEKMKTGKNVVITNVMAKMKEEKELVDQNVDAIKIKLEMANKKVNELTPVLEDAKDDVVESFTKGLDAAKDQVNFFHKGIDLSRLGYFKVVQGNQIIDHMATVEDN